MSLLIGSSANPELDEKNTLMVVKLVADIRNGKLENPHTLALSTLTMLEQIISDCPTASPLELTQTLRACGLALTRAAPLALVAANMVRRVLRALRDEHRACDQTAGESLHRLVAGVRSRRGTVVLDPDARGALKEQLDEIRLETESSLSVVAATARALAHSQRVLAAGRSLRRWLTQARAHVHTWELELAEQLCSSGLPVTVISEAAVCAVMPRIDKVVIEVEAVLSGGAALARTGYRAVAAAAKHYCVPVLALAPLYALTPLHASGHQLAGQAAPTSVSYECAESGVCQTHSPRFECIPPDHITLFVTSLGGTSPSYIYRLLSELYDPKDYSFE